MILNIGHAIGSRPFALCHSGIVAMVRTLAHVIDATQADSNTERTSILHLRRDLTRSELYRLAVSLRQDAIACYSFGQRDGALIGPKAAEWGAFDPSLFLMLDGKPLDASRARVRLAA